MRLEKGVKNGDSVIELWLEGFDLNLAQQKLSKKEWLDIIECERKYWIGEQKVAYDANSGEEQEYIDEYLAGLEKGYKRDEYLDFMINYNPKVWLPNIFGKIRNLFKSNNLVVLENKDCDGDELMQETEFGCVYYLINKTSESGWGSMKKFDRATDMRNNWCWVKELVLAYVDKKPYIIEEASEEWYQCHYLTKPKSVEGKVSEQAGDECSNKAKDFENRNFSSICKLSKDEFIKKYVKKDLLVLTPTTKQFDRLLEVANDFGFCDCDGKSWLECNYVSFEYHKENTAFELDYGDFTDASDWYHEHMKREKVEFVD